MRDQQDREESGGRGRDKGIKGERLIWGGQIGVLCRNFWEKIKQTKTTD